MDQVIETEKKSRSKQKSKPQSENQSEETSLATTKKKGPGKGNHHPNMSGLVHFKKGYDPRRNNKGAPKEATQVRKMIRNLAAEVINVGKGKNSREVTRLQKLVLGMLSSDSPVDRVNILKALYPELFSENVNVKNSGPVKLNVVYIDNRGKETVNKDDIIEGLEVKDE